MTILDDVTAGQEIPAPSYAFYIYHSAHSISAWIT